MQRFNLFYWFTPKAFIHSCMKGEFKTFTGKSLRVWPPFWSHKALWTWLSHDANLRGCKERLDHENVLSHAISLYCMSEKHTDTQTTLMASAVLYFVKSDEATKCRSLNNLRFLCVFHHGWHNNTRTFQCWTSTLWNFFLIGRIRMRLFFIFAPCILIFTQFIHQQMHIYKTLIRIYVKVRWLLHVSVCDHHQGACSWAWLKLYWCENIQ